ncbi:MAG: TIGR03905 family TSCPD domain-containing protein, partial [Clostridia bacterium]
MFSYQTRGTCSRRIDLDIQGDIIASCRFQGGCAGNTQGVSRLVQGRRIDEVLPLLQGIQCRNGTSCPDQLAHALLAYL